MTDSAITPEYGPDEARQDMQAVLEAVTAFGSDEPYRRLADYIERLEALKKAGDALVNEASHPTRHGSSRFLNAIVAYRRISEGVGQ